ncbi:YqzK family protein [Bacillus massiliglaciei]|uniref:YqzK family protein n=1 Tax=Bacillus massiliglaciei TaxID=1816693 RepID=UPI000DA605AC|nr:YqzK family protein [Bacillus massiliglaciei]
MKSTLSMILQTAKVLFLFVSFTVLFYIGMVWLNQEYESYHRYEEPEGAAVKVAKSVESEDRNWLDRLMLLYLNGE